MVKAVVLGGGVAGTVVANRLARSGQPVEVTLVDSHGKHVHQPGLLEVGIGTRAAERLERDERALIDRRVRLVVGRAAEIRVEQRRVRLDSGADLPYDALVVATGARSDTRAIEGYREGAYHFHCLRRAPQLAEAIAGFRGGRVVLGATSLPYKCPPSILSFALLLDERLRREGRRAATEITYVYPVAGVQPAAAASALGERLLAERGIRVVAPFPVASIEPAARKLLARDGRAIEYDLLVLVPPHAGAPVIAGAGLAPAGGFVPVDPETLRAKEDRRVYALGDAAEIAPAGAPPVPKSGEAARRQAATVAANVLADLFESGRLERYDGGATFLAPTGGGRAMRVDFRYGEAPCVYPPRRAHYWMKWAADRLYFTLIARA